MRENKVNFIALLSKMILGLVMVTSMGCSSDGAGNKSQLQSVESANQQQTDMMVKLGTRPSMHADLPLVAVFFRLDQDNAQGLIEQRDTVCVDNDDQVRVCEGAKFKFSLELRHKDLRSGVFTDKVNNQEFLFQCRSSDLEFANETGNFNASIVCAQKSPLVEDLL